MGSDRAHRTEKVASGSAYDEHEPEWRFTRYSERGRAEFSFSDRQCRSC
jgi:hypothetical protein